MIPGSKHTPETRAKISAALKGKPGIALPPWVPADLVEDFCDMARLAGEEAAASHVRKLKREGAIA